MPTAANNKQIIHVLLFSFLLAHSLAFIREAGRRFDKVVLVHNGSAEAYGVSEDTGRLGLLYKYRGRAGKDCLVIGGSAAASTASDNNTNIRGSIIGGTALVDTDATKYPYPNTVKATGRCDYVEWDISELRAQMSQNKAVEAAVYSIL